MAVKARGALLRCPASGVRRQLRSLHSMRIYRTEVDPVDQVQPVKLDLDAKKEVHEILRWSSPRTDPLCEEPEPVYPVPPATPVDELTFNDIGSMYRLSDEDMRNYFQEGFCGNIVKAFAPPLQPRCFLYRKLSHLLNIYISKLQDFQLKKDVLYELRNDKAGFILDGPWGCGKSAILNQVVHFARSRGILTLYIPDASAWTSGSFVVPSSTLPGYFDNPNEMLQLLKYFCRMECNEKILSERKLTRKYEVPKQVSKHTRMDTLWDLLHYAFDDIETTPIIFKYFLDELIAIKDIPMVIVVDSFDSFCKYTEYHDMATDVIRDMPKDGFDMKVVPKDRIHANKLTLVRALNYIMLANEPNKLVVAASCRQVGDRTQSAHDFSPFFPDQDTILHPLEVPSQYDDYELRTMLRFYLETMEGADDEGVPLDSGWSFRRLEMPSFERTLYKLKFITNSNPYLVWNESDLRHTWAYEYERHRQYLTRKRSELVTRLASQTRTIRGA